ncbi:hypothetical protein RD792_009084 [Penstemon davidsonii]|uniref:Cytochrome P450 n=1 Tax=Penstemon davidsonii TaxID=160366 RepID=A0ABR0DB34_9LAMI|nr:hypothetical protein RD792_009084 [Penstemon davidsonii]
MDQFYIAALSILVIVISMFWYTKKPTSKSPPLPPGPRGLPIVGYLPFLNQNLLVQFTGLAHKYGPIYKIQLGTKLWVVIGSPSLTKEVVRDHDSVFANRDAPIAAQVATYGINDIAWSPNNYEWRKMRKIFVREMQSNISLEGSYNLRKDVVRKAIKDVYNTKMDKTIEIGELVFLTVLNVGINLLWGETIDEGEEGEKIVAEFKKVIPKFVDLFGKANVSDFFPILAGLDIQGVKRDMEIQLQSIDRILDALIAQCMKKLSEIGKDEGRKDFLQILLELKEKEDSEMSITLKQLKAILIDIVTGGTDTSSTTIEWAMAELMNNLEVKTKVQKELSDIVGLDNIVEESHMPKLQYLEAVVKETMRLHPAIPFLVPRSPSQSSIIGGYTIPKNTTVFINVWSIQRDPSIWEKPLEFKPERFLNNNGKFDSRGNNFSYLPFGSGRRVCVGMPLAERMIIYLLASLLHSFEWKLPQGEELDMTEKFGIVLRKNTPLYAIPSPRLSDLHLYA